MSGKRRPHWSTDIIGHHNHQKSFHTGANDLWCRSALKPIYEGQSNENRTPSTKWQWNLFYSKVIARSVKTFIPLGDETINSSLVERGRSLMDPQPHPILHFLVRMKLTSPDVFLQVVKNVKVTREKIWPLRKMLKVFPSQIAESYPLPNWQNGDRRYHAKGWFRPTVFQRVLTSWRVATPSSTKKRTTYLCSCLRASIFNAGRTHFTLHSPPEQ